MWSRKSVALQFRDSHCCQTKVVTKWFAKTISQNQFSYSDKQLYIANCCHQSQANPCRQVLDIAQKVPNCTQCIASNEPTICHLHSRNQTSSLFTASALCHAVCSNHGRNAMQLVQSIGVRPCRFPMTTVYTTPFLNGTCKWADISALNLNQLPNASCSVKRFHQTMHHHWQGSSAWSITNRSLKPKAKKVQPEGSKGSAQGAGRFWPKLTKVLAKDTGKALDKRFGRFKPKTEKILDGSQRRWLWFSTPPFDV